MHFHDRIAQLVYTFPEDAPTSTGTLFWSAPKRFPRALEWSAADPSHVAFVQAAALLRAEVFGIMPPAWAQDPAKVIPPACDSCFCCALALVGSVCFFGFFLWVV